MVELVVEAYVETESLGVGGSSWTSISSFNWSIQCESARFGAEDGLSLMTVGAVLLERAEASVFVELELPPLPARSWVDL